MINLAASAIRPNLYLVVTGALLFEPPIIRAGTVAGRSNRLAARSPEIHWRIRFVLHRLVRHRFARLLSCGVNGGVFGGLSLDGFQLVGIDR